MPSPAERTRDACSTIRDLLASGHGIPEDLQDEAESLVGAAAQVSVRILAREVGGVTKLAQQAEALVERVRQAQAEARVERVQQAGRLTIYDVLVAENDVGPSCETRRGTEATIHLPAPVPVQLAQSQTCAREAILEQYAGRDAGAETPTPPRTPLTPPDNARLPHQISQTTAEPTVASVVRTIGATPTETGWPALALTQAPALPSFPVRALPEWQRDFVMELSESRQVTVDGPAMLSLAAIGAAAAKRVVVHAGGDDIHPINIWVAVIMRSGEGKSPVVRPLARPFERAQQQLGEQAALAARDFRVDRAVLEQRSRAVIRACARARTGDEREALRKEALELEAQLNRLKEYTEPRVYTEDTTLEALTRSMARSKGALALISDEGSSFFANASRRAPGGIDAIESLLRAHSGMTIVVDRVSRPSVVVHEPALSVAITTQSRTFGRLLRRESLEGRGLWERFLIIQPWSRAGERVGLPPAMDRAAVTTYNAAIHSLFALPVIERTTGNLRPRELRLLPEAQERLRAFSEAIDRRMAPDGDLRAEPIIGWAQKLRTNVVRLAGILRLAEGGSPTGATGDRNSVISADVFGRAEEIATYCLAHAQRLITPESASGDDVRVALDWLRSRGEPTFRARDLQRYRRAQFPNAAFVEPVTRLLLEANAIRPAPNHHRVGRPPDEYEVHPDLRSRSSTPGVR